MGLRLKARVARIRLATQLSLTRRDDVKSQPALFIALCDNRSVHNHIQSHKYPKSEQAKGTINNKPDRSVIG